MWDIIWSLNKHIKQFFCKHEYANLLLTTICAKCGKIK